MPRLSVIVPVLNEAAGIEPLLASLAPLRARGAEVVVVDGGSHDGTAMLATPAADRVLSAPRGRGTQLNAGAVAARGEVLLFLHADTRLPADADATILDGLARSNRRWGRFDVTIEGRSAALPLVAFLMNMRSRVTGIATGDQAIFVERAAFAEAGGFPDIPLMEDIEFSRRLKRLSPPLCLRARVVTSGRRWDERGAWRTVVLMWRLRLAHLFGTAPDVLARRYGYAPRRS
jgi:rSAM/selenodomain-associated transferase 2